VSASELLVAQQQAAAIVKNRCVAVDPDTRNRYDRSEVIISKRVARPREKRRGDRRR
jgi:hypothetical protein